MSVLHLYGCAAPPVLHIATPIAAAQERGWTVCLGLTPTAADWLGAELPALADVTGHTVRIHPRRPGQHVERPWPAPDAIAAAPLTLNSLNAWALGLTPSHAVSALVEALGTGAPTVAMPCVKTTLAAHPQMDRSVEVLRSAGVRVLYGDGGWVPNPPGQGRPEAYPWHLVLDAAERHRIS